jgi:Tfp pilus assembly protein PilV
LRPVSPKGHLRLLTLLSVLVCFTTDSQIGLTMGEVLCMVGNVLVLSVLLGYTNVLLKNLNDPKDSKHQAAHQSLRVKNTQPCTDVENRPSTYKLSAINFQISDVLYCMCNSGWLGFLKFIRV